MTAQSYQLQPFPDATGLPAIQISGTVARSANNQLTIDYKLEGAVNQIQLPSPNPEPLRRWELWETTCFELFIGCPETLNYWEFNFSPNGNWNAFALENYRKGIREESQIEQVNTIARNDSAGFQLETTIPLEPIVPADQSIELSITAVIETQEKNISFWATKHCSPEADFHQRNSFTIQL
ncbi:DOMON-like domain-containing protein [filamentous cyanobacterium LEGE 11480]|uniref:DOMON-like domain-containing protein n=1 Tax=Romeriopsis navalis LEGE 11480 TaxID=2777977 RepID=A0A928Z1F2_9CYAN|nr:DOMON-like domain-containing protein [Romeriopsis navalis]MBE9028444.1 DOMON-like domain-containing protein [Romeriopsis navalis LEGE 11480]